MLAKLHRAEATGVTELRAEPFRWEAPDGAAASRAGASEPWVGAGRAGLADEPSGHPSFQFEFEAMQQQLERTRLDAEAQARESYRQGFEAGRGEARTEYGTEIDALHKQIAGSISSVDAARRGALEQADEDLVRLSVAIAEKVLNRQIQIDPLALQGLVKTALGRLAGRAAHCARLHPADRAAVEKELNQLGATRTIRVVDDPTLERGSLLLDTDFGMLDCSVHTQLEEIERGLVDRLRRTDG